MLEVQADKALLPVPIHILWIGYCQILGFNISHPTHNQEHQEYCTLERSLPWPGNIVPRLTPNGYSDSIRPGHCRPPQTHLMQTYAHKTPHMARSSFPSSPLYILHDI